MPQITFSQTRRLILRAMTEMGEEYSRFQAGQLARVCISIWSGDETPDLVKDPTAREAIRRVLAQIDHQQEDVA